MFIYFGLFLFFGIIYAWIRESIHDYYHRKRLKELKREMNRTYGYVDTDNLGKDD